MFHVSLRWIKEELEIDIKSIKKKREAILFGTEIISLNFHHFIFQSSRILSYKFLLNPNLTETLYWSW